MKIAAFIPNRISNKVVLGFFDFLRKLQKFLFISNHRSKRNTEENKHIFSKHMSINLEVPQFIENQNAYTDMKYGKSTIQYAGCEVIAVYNALKSLLVDNISFPELISKFEKDGMVLSGLFGTAPRALYDYLVGRGLEAKLVIDREGFAALEEKYKTFILTFYNDRDNIMKKVHTICITTENGGLIAHNIYGNGSAYGPYKSFEELQANLNGGKTKWISMIGIENPEKKAD